MEKIDFYGDRIFFEIQEFKKDEKIKHELKKCILAQKEKGLVQYQSFYKQNPEASYEVSEEALQDCLANGDLISDIRTDRSISNCISFNSKNLAGSVMDDEVLKLRRRADSLMAERVKELFLRGYKLSVQDSGHFWYPEGGYMGWHTNVRTPGWRFYVNYAEEPGKSFFRYRDPFTGEIVTSWDEEWNFRLFRIDVARPFWHSVYSGTNRFSVGYKINKTQTPGFSNRVIGSIKRMLQGSSV